MTRVCPVMVAALSLAKKTTALATSSGWLSRFMGMGSTTSGGKPISRMAGVSTPPGATQFTRTPSPAHSTAACMVTATTAPLEAE